MSRGQRDPLETSLLFDVFAVSQAVGRLLGEAMRGGPLSPGEYATYSAVFELEAASPTALAARLGMPVTTFVDQLRAMEQRGHARRIPNPADRRSYHVVLTAAGLAAHRAANHAFERASAAFNRSLGEDAANARTVLQAVRDAANRAREAGGSAVLATRPSGGRAG